MGAGLRSRPGARFWLGCDVGEVRQGWSVRTAGCIEPIYRGLVKSKRQNHLGLTLLKLWIPEDRLVLVKCILTVTSVRIHLLGSGGFLLPPREAGRTPGQPVLDADLL